MERIDFLGAYRLNLLAAGVDAGAETWGDQPEAPFPLLFGWAGFLNEGETSTIYFHSDFETPARPSSHRASQRLAYRRTRRGDPARRPRP